MVLAAPTFGLSAKSTPKGGALKIEGPSFAISFGLINTGCKNALGINETILGLIICEGYHLADSSLNFIESKEVELPSSFWPQNKAEGEL